MSPSIPEYVLYAFLNYFPYIVLVLYPLRNHLRFSKVTTGILCALSCLVQILLLVAGHTTRHFYGEYASYVATLCNLLFYFLCFKSRIGRLLFNMLMVTNVANFVVVAAKTLEGILFPDMVYGMYMWSFSLCMVIVEIFILIPFFFYVKYYSNMMDCVSSDSTIWNFCWIVPLTFYLVWFYIFYHSRSISSLELALDPANMFFNYFIIMGQLLIYAYIANLASSYSKIIQLEENQHQLSLQSVQYEKIKEQIKETRVMRHDVRHHMNLMCQYADNKEYDKLDAYLHEFSQTVHQISTVTYCNHVALNMLLVYHSNICCAAHIDFQASLCIPDESPLSDSDTTILFGNAIENAFDACNTMPNDAERFVRITGKHIQNQLLFCIENTFDNTITKDDTGSFQSTKHAGTGIGTMSIKNIVSQHNGTVYFETANHIFRVSIVLPYK